MLGLIGTACGGDDDSAATTTTTEVIAIATTTTVPPPVTDETTTTVPPTVEVVTEGAKVVVANASGVNGAAGRLTDRLAAVGFDMVAATNSADTVSNLATTQIYYDASVEAARVVADSLRQVLGGGDIEVLEVTVPALTASGELGEADVLVLMGDDVADRPLDELQGRVPAPADPGDDKQGDDEQGDDDSTTG